MAKPKQTTHFTHIHCTSRNDRSAAVLETDLDTWMADSSLITLTEVDSGRRAASLREKGWGYWCARQPGGQSDDAGICWWKGMWHERDHWVRKLTGRYQGPGGYVNGIYATSVLLHHVGANQRLLVSVTHLPSGVEGAGDQHWVGNAWAERKQAYNRSMTNWSQHVRQLCRSKKPHALLLVADFNLDLKDKWVRDYLQQHWAVLDLRSGWQEFPSAGTSLDGDRMIDGSYMHGLSTLGARLLPRVNSASHRPFTEYLQLDGGGVEESSKPTKFYDPATGSVRKGKEWWGFGDYTYDELFETQKKQDDGSTVVTFEFDKPPY
jgi:hypothetical protein